jgi:hypothetical protein
MKRPRKVFGRLTVEIAGVKWRFEMTRSVVAVRQKHHRFHPIIKFSEILRLAKKQTELFDETKLVRPLAVPKDTYESANRT